MLLLDIFVMHLEHMPVILQCEGERGRGSKKTPDVKCICSGLINLRYLTESKFQFKSRFQLVVWFVRCSARKVRVSVSVKHND